MWNAHFNVLKCTKWRWLSCLLYAAALIHNARGLALNHPPCSGDYYAYNLAESTLYQTKQQGLGSTKHYAPSEASETELQLPPLPAGHYYTRLRNSSKGAQWQQRLLLN